MNGVIGAGYQEENRTVVEHPEYPFAPVWRECVVKHGCQVQQAHGEGEDACADDSCDPAPLDCTHDENRGSDYGS